MHVKRIYELAQKSLKTLRDYGPLELAKRSWHYVGARIKSPNSQTSDIQGSYKDILFISGCDLPHPQRYRVSHQIEQLESAGLTCDMVFYADLKLEQLKFYRSFIFYRCPILPVVRQFIEQAKLNHKTTFFDIDDLVFDTKYTNQIPYVQTLTGPDRALYDDGVKRMGETLHLCDFGIASTNRLQTEMGKILPEVFVNHNVASEEMLKLSNEAIKSVKRDDDKIILGYFSGTITHNADFNMIKQAIIDLLKKYDNVYLKIVGLLELPPELQELKDKIIIAPFCDWHKLPNLIRSVDINLAPIEDTVFNEAKSENKWTEAALVEVPTVASQVGAFKDIIKHRKTGILCENDYQAWYNNIELLIKDASLRNRLAKNARAEVEQNCLTTKTGQPLAEFIRSKLAKSIYFVVPSTNISGGVMVIEKHAEILRKHGYDVTLLNAEANEEPVGDGLNVVSAIRHDFLATADIMVATMWLTLDYVLRSRNVKHKKYLVQNYEPGFYPLGDHHRLAASATYSQVPNVEYITISRWVQDWLKEDYNVSAKYAPNGIDSDRYVCKKRNFSRHKKIRILIEGSSSHAYKNVDESFRIANSLDPKRYEIIYLSYDDKSKSWYRIDKAYFKVPYQSVHKIYEQADILLKSSRLESFSYPPLEMMATGGFCVVAPNGGNREFLRDGYNCLFYELGNPTSALVAIERIASDKSLRERLTKGAIETVKSRHWQDLESQIIKLYR